MSPLAIGLALTVLLALTWRRLPRSARAAGLALEFLLLASMTPLGANVLVGMIESQVPSPPACGAPVADGSAADTAAPATIVVLSAGFTRAPVASDDFSALRGDSVQRALSGVLLWRRSAGATLVFAGGGPFAISESEVLQHFAQQLGVPAQQIRREDRSQTTWENAQQLRALAPALPARIWLVSSALHLPRALIAFRAQGFDSCPWPSARRYLPPGGFGYYLPQSSALLKTEAAIHELAGAAWYRWRAAAH